MTTTTPQVACCPSRDAITKLKHELTYYAGLLDPVDAFAVQWGEIYYTIF